MSTTDLTERAAKLFTTGVLLGYKHSVGRRQTAVPEAEIIWVVLDKKARELFDSKNCIEALQFFDMIEAETRPKPPKGWTEQKVRPADAFVQRTSQYGVMFKCRYCKRKPWTAGYHREHKRTCHLYVEKAS